MIIVYDFFNEKYLTIQIILFHHINISSIIVIKFFSQYLIEIPYLMILMIDYKNKHYLCLYYIYHFLDIILKC